MNYLTNHNYQSIVYFNNSKIIKVNEPPHQLINNICNRYLVNYNNYRKLIKKYLGIKNKTPIYLNDQMILFPVNSVLSYDNTWINYANIKSIEMNELNNFIVIIFNNNEKFITNITREYYFKKVNQINKIIRYIDGLAIVNIFK